MTGELSKHLLISGYLLSFSIQKKEQMSGEKIIHSINQFILKITHLYTKSSVSQFCFQYNTTIHLAVQDTSS
jgi:hypothetical protein